MMTRRLSSLLPIAACAGLLPMAAHAGSALIDQWTAHLVSASRLVIVFSSVLGIAYAALSLTRAYRADMDDVRMRHMGAALFAGIFTIIGVLIGWVSLIVVGA